jgi:NCAIR mutase (PurE)-related protein
VNNNSLLSVLDDVRSGKLSPSDAAARLRDLPYENLGHTRVDHHRSLRKGYPEVIYGEGKSPPQVLEIAQSLFKNKQMVMLTRASPEQAQTLLDEFPGAVHHHDARMVVIASSSPASPTQGIGCVAVISGGTSDQPIAEEAAVTAESMGSRVTRAYDVGVAGLHRLLAEMDSLREANVIVAVAGMEGALPSVVAGLVESPVIAVPTSIGYGANMGGLTTLFAMLASCADGISVVNIDNGFGAGFQAHLINRLASIK